MKKEEAMSLLTYAELAYSTIPTVFSSFLLARECIEKNVPGDFVECGVFSGCQCAAMALAGDRTIHLLDSFEGIPMAGEHDGPDIRGLIGDGHGELVSSGKSVASMEIVQRYMAMWGVDPSRLVYHKGWFQHTLPHINIGEIALLRLDGDLYESTKVCLDHLYPRLSIGGYCVVDDYNLAGCRKAVFDFFGYAPSVTEIVGGHGPVYWIKKTN